MACRKSRQSDTSLNEYGSNQESCQASLNATSLNRKQPATKSQQVQEAANRLNFRQNKYGPVVVQNEFCKISSRNTGKFAVN
jgi:hypothetical protein